MSDDLTLDEYIVPDDDENGPSAICERLVRTCEEFVHLREGEPNILILFRGTAKVKAGRTVLGECMMPSVQGSLRTMFEWLMIQKFGYFPDFLIILDRDFWFAIDDTGREALMFHELMHADQATDQFGAPRFSKETGLPVWRIRGHDIEEFNAVVKRYGAWLPDIQSFISVVSGNDGK